MNYVDEDISILELFVYFSEYGNVFNALMRLVSSPAGIDFSLSQFLFIQPV